MMYRIFYIAIFITCAVFNEVLGQADNDPPDSPLLNLVTVQPESGFTELYWKKSIAPDVAGYVIYYFKNNEGFAIDTIFNPEANSYLNVGSGSKFRSEAYVVAALDTAGNVSPLSNSLSTIFVEVAPDTCRRMLKIKWNFYESIPYKVNEYRIIVTENGGNIYEAGKVNSGENHFDLNNIRNGVNYCVVVEALLENGLKSSSNKQCLQVKMQKDPEWINADYATVGDNGEILLSFSVDPESEIRSYRLERKREGESEFSFVKDFTINVSNNIIYTDNTADISKKHYYRMAAINNCGIPSVYSNIAGNIVAEIKYSGDIMTLSWNLYKGWRGGILNQEVAADFGEGPGEFAIILAQDSSMSIRYADLMYRISGPEICFYIIANELPNELGIAGTSRSNKVCLPVEEKVFVPNTFTPDNDNINDLFKPVLSFMPVSYLLVITDTKNTIVFKTSSWQDSWDGTKDGRPVPSGIYLWYLKITTPGGKKIQKSGTVTVIRNR